MADSNRDKTSYVDFDGRTIVDVNALLRDPKVQATIDRISKEREKFRGKGGVTFIRPVKQRG